MHMCIIIHVSLLSQERGNNINILFVFKRRNTIETILAIKMLSERDYKKIVIKITPITTPVFL